MRPFLAVVVAAAAVLGAACSSTALPRASGTGGRLPVVAGENPWGDIARQIGGRFVAVRSLINDPGADPHLFESDAAIAAAVSRAAVVVENGLGYDDFVDKLRRASRSQRVVNAADVLGVHGHDANPHLWYDAARAPLVARAIAAAFAAADPAHRADYTANEATFERALQPVIAEVAAIRARHARTPVAYTERVPEYLLDAAGLDVRTPRGFAEAVEDGDNPSPSATAAIDDLISGRGIRALVYNVQATTPVTDRVREAAVHAGIAVVAMSETLPKRARDYQSWQLAQDRALRRALGG